MIKVGLVGIGKTGKEIARVLLEQDDMKLSTIICRPGSDKAGKDLGEIIGSRNTGITIDTSDKLENIIFKCKPDVILDFSTPGAAIRNARIFSKMKINIVVATTGLSQISIKKLFVYTKIFKNGIVYAPNITLGVNVLMLITKITAAILCGYDFCIKETHYKKKKDIPSATAQKIANEIEKGLSWSGVKVKDGGIPIHAVRAGEIVGRHEVMIAGDEDKIEIVHESLSRRVFAYGALKAVRFLYSRTGYYEMSDVLDLGEILKQFVKDNNVKNQTKTTGLIARKTKKNNR